MAANESSDVTQLLKAWRNGDDDAGRQLITTVYDQLRQIASACLAKEYAVTGLQPTALLNELYIALFSHEPVSCNDRLHFLNLATRQMRNLVVDHARTRNAVKRGVEYQKLCLDEARDHAIIIDSRLPDLNDALDRLEKLDARCAKVVELRFFGGLTEQEIATLLEISVPTVRRDWEFSRSWLLAQLEG